MNTCSKVIIGLLALASIFIVVALNRIGKIDHRTAILECANGHKEARLTSNWVDWSANVNYGGKQAVEFNIRCDHCGGRHDLVMYDTTTLHKVRDMLRGAGAK